jgi:hypothetical protein
MNTNTNQPVLTPAHPNHMAIMVAYHDAREIVSCLARVTLSDTYKTPEEALENVRSAAFQCARIERSFESLAAALPDGWLTATKDDLLTFDSALWLFRSAEEIRILKDGDWI